MRKKKKVGEEGKGEEKKGTERRKEKEWEGRMRV